ncbi:MAG: DUF3772 domain-containing protein [Pseudomonadota bacterium]
MRIWIVFIVALLAASAHAQPDVQTLQEGVEARQAALADIAEALGGDELDLVALGEELRRIRRRGETEIAAPRDRKPEIEADLERIGPAPEPEAPPEAPEISEERARLLGELSDIDALIRQSDLNLAEIARLFDDIAVLRRDAFYDRILARGPSPLWPPRWAAATASLSASAGRAAEAVGAWRNALRDDARVRQAYGALAFASVFALVMFWPVRSLINQNATRRIERMTPLRSRRVLAAGMRTAARAVPSLLGGFVIYETLRAYGAIPESAVSLARAIWFGFVALLVVDGAATGVFSPKSAEWRVLPLESREAPVIRVLLMLAAFLLVADAALVRAGVLFGASEELASQHSALVTFGLAFILLGLCRKSLWRIKESRAKEIRDATKKSWGRLRRLGQLAAIALILATAAGYVALGHYAATRLYAVTGLAAVAWFVRALLREAVRLVDRRFTSETSDADEGERLMFFWIGAAIDLATLLLIAPPILIILGADWADIRALIQNALFGFQIGPIRISLAQIFSAFTAFVALLTLTRFTQRQMEHTLFPRTRLDIGVRNSFKTLVGYVGLIIAFLVGVSMMGLDLSNLAIIAGALSVGIGFGLQSIVNNFVSGLILLFERPIKVGDWIVTSSGEGLVKRISVRSTEIETFDRSSIIVPNSELISAAVTNWTHKDKVGRVIIAVGVSYDDDPQTVIDILQGAAKEHPAVLDYPAPFVYFDDFGDNALSFQLRAYVRDINSSLSVRTQLRVAIFNAFKAAGVSIPFPQRDIHIHQPADKTTPPRTPGADLDTPLGDGAASAP